MDNTLSSRPVNGLIAKFSVPAIISMLVGALYNIVDQIFIGNGVEPNAIGATTVAFPIVTVCMAVALLCGVGGASSFNLESGRGEHAKARHAVGTALSMMIIGGGLVMVVVLLFTQQILRLCGATDALMGYSVDYASITALGLPLLVLTSGGAHLIRADKSPNYSMACLLSGALINTALDPLFIFGFGWGIKGAAWATVIGQAVSASLVVFYFLRRQKMSLAPRHLLLRRHRMLRVAALGSAASINQLAILVVQILMNNQLTKYGAQSVYGAETALNCAGAIGKVAMIFYGIAIGISQGCQPIWGYNYGAQNYERVREVYRKSAVLCLSVGVFFFAVFQIFPVSIIKMFGISDEAGVAFAVRYFRIFMFMTFANGLQPMSSGFFTSIGKARLGIITSLMRQIVFFVPLALLLPMWQGLDGIVFAGPIADLAAVSIAIFFALRELERTKNLTKTNKSIDINAATSDN